MLPAIPTCGHQLNEQKFCKEVSFTGKSNVAWGAEWSDSCMHINSTNSEVVFMAFHELKLKLTNDELTKISNVNVEQKIVKHTI
jgi:hypothetical protein